MNVLQFREHLQALEAEGNGELTTKLSYNYSDQWSTQVEADKDTVETGMVKYKEYHSMDNVIDTEEAFAHKDTRCIVLLG